MVTRIGGAVSEDLFQKVEDSLTQKLLSPEAYGLMANLPLHYGAALYGLGTLAELEAGNLLLFFPDPVLQRSVL
ncbi:hypothetical protein FOQG_15278 [Fusarium oxysporum f. sp. raphani 54005]|uniref:Uncharacterized protein n=2 Tax=Fusarium oxysporum TaxID=5507 RepID=X0BDK8_FUSOX|nr:hypothetical protein FOVG_16704 [Fusarium oxysporum f. sp. pisi HDV247]EXK80200.1 hypothetical protein FOQG_15278 [Fusarium oxysporum f. sp. raphani 54005]KAJ4034283.1 hypothetical protein NW763_014299 [Fusarium oxysporum]KAK2686826.1 hypothetical protein QWA68_014631 [Fusarium oxysporum]